MALKDQPYFPFYVKDFDGDEKLKECDANAHGVYIRVMCLMHKSKTYGRILLEQKYQQLYQQTIQHNNQQVSNICSDFAGMFALKLIKHLPFTLVEVQNGLCQLLENDVIQVEGDYLCQKRMMKDGKISDIRASAGRKSASGKGGSNNFVGTKLPTNTPTHLPTNEPTKSQQNTAIAIAIEDNRGIGNTIGVQGENFTGEEETNFPDHYLGNWNLNTKIDDCLKYYSERVEFQEDRKKGLELFKKQYVELPDDEIYDRLLAWGKKFNDTIMGKYPERSMRGDNSWIQHFHNWLALKNLSENPIKNFINNNKKIRTKTIDEVLAEREGR